ncbi:MAG: transporter substrate-binding domain-containing protein, partial [Pseudomonadota bacterium]|nr:transporter substrate-binding domain-containing protein [Pseudomonadota bacterium]
FVLGAALLGLVPPVYADRGVLEAVRSRGYVVCGVGDGPKGYSSVSPQGVWSGISVDFCKAVAAGVIGTKDAVKFRLLPADDGFSALQSGEIDVLSRNIGMTSTRDSNNLNFTASLVPMTPAASALQKSTLIPDHTPCGLTEE